MNVSNLTLAGKLLALAAAAVTVAWGVGAGVWIPQAAPFWRLVGILPGLATFAAGGIGLWVCGVRVFKPDPGRRQPAAGGADAAPGATADLGAGPGSGNS